jgi:dTDP-4-dehydrorhamnose reductase
VVPRGPVPPDVIGINHYVTSERVLDEDMLPYPRDRWGGNARETYADMEAPRVRAQPSGGWGMLIREAWERYHLPIAMTEVHLGGPRDEQLRWLSEAWNTCLELQALEQIDIRAVTAWLLFGAYDWNTLPPARMTSTSLASSTCAHLLPEPLHWPR